MESVDIYNKFREKTGNIKGRKELTNGDFALNASAILDRLNYLI